MSRKRSGSIVFLFLIGLVLLVTCSRGKPPMAARMDSLKQGPSYGQISKSPGRDWLTYSGDYQAKRYSLLQEINKKNVARLAAKWSYHLDYAANLRTTPIVYNGVMYVANAYEMLALDAVTGEKRWTWQAPNYGEDGTNRGAAILNKKLFFITGDCVLVALNYQTGKLVWQKQYARARQKYYCTLAPLALRDRLIVGVSGGDNGARGFVLALAADDGKELWRFRTVPAATDPERRTWLGGKIGGAATWLTGSYDPESDLVYWPTGNPWPDFDGSKRQGKNLYSNCLLALDAETGKLKWFFQTMPHDVHDWDATEPLVLADIAWRGRPSKLLLQANRNGFFYVLDRLTGEFLLGKPFAKVTWASGLDAIGRPIVMPGKYDTWNNGQVKGVCPGLVGATNWMSPSYSPLTGLFYVVTLEHCDMEPGDYHLRALDPSNGEIRWDYLMPRTGPTYAGVVSTAGGLVFAGDAAGHLIALDSSTGRRLWQFSLGRTIAASPMTYAVNGRQYVALAAGPDIFVFGLFE